MRKILVVEDDDNLRTIILQFLRNRSYQVQIAENGRVALEILKKNSFDLIITDLLMPEVNGVDLIEKARSIYPDIGCLVITAYGTVQRAVEVMKKGAFDFITKPFSISHLESRIERFYEYKSLEQENRNLRRQLASEKRQKKLIGQSKAMQQIFDQIDIVGKSEATVFIRGESGTGKELIAQAIHDVSDRADKPFLKINCAAIPETLFESTLFGHEKGSFSGAYKTQKGVFEECDSGTLLLDEISEIPLSMQAKLLRVLQEFMIVRVGSTAEIPVDVRIIATSNRDMYSLIKEGKFREDLFFRLNVFPITVPSLKQHAEDIPLLVDHFLKFFCEKYGCQNKTIAEEAMDELLNCEWPGNVRQLEHIIERAVLVANKSGVIKSQHLLFDPPLKEPEAEFATNGTIYKLEDVEKKLVYAALKKTGNHRTEAAKLLGINVRTLRNKLKLYESDPSPN